MAKVSGPAFAQTSGSQRERQGFAKEQRDAGRVALACGSENASPAAHTGHPNQHPHSWASAAFQDGLVLSLMMSERHSRKEWKAGEDQGNIPEKNRGHRVSRTPRLSNHALPGAVLSGAARGGPHRHELRAAEIRGTSRGEAREVVSSQALQSDYLVQIPAQSPRQVSTSGGVVRST